MFRKLSQAINKYACVIIWVIFLTLQIFFWELEQEPRPIDVLTPTLGCIAYSILEAREEDE